MRLEGRRTSNNVEDRRRTRGGTKASLGIGGLIIVGLIIWLIGGNPLDVLTSQLGQLSENTTTDYVPSNEEEALAKFSETILAGTEDVWTAEFKKCNRKDIRFPMHSTMEPPPSGYAG